DFASKSDQLLSQLAEDEKKPDERANRAFKAAVYGKHPFGRPPAVAEMVKKLTPKDLKAFHQTVFRPNNTVVAIVGAFDTDKVVAQVKRLTAGGKPVDLPQLAPQAPPTQEKFSQSIITDPNAAQLTVYLGHLGIKRDNPDYYKLLVMDHVLGTGPGFTD